MVFDVAVLPKKQKYDCVTEDDYVYVRSKSRPLTRFCDTNYDIIMHRQTAIRAVLTTTKVLPRRGTFEEERNGNIRVMPHKSVLHAILSPSGGVQIFPKSIALDESHFLYDPVAFHPALPPRKQQYDCVIEDDYVYVRSKSRLLTCFCDTYYNIINHRQTAMRAVLTMGKVLPR